MANPTRMLLGAATALSLTLAAVAPVQAEEVSFDTVVATVNGQDITAGHVFAFVGRLPAQYQQVPIDQIYSAILDQLINQRLMAESVEAPVWFESAMDNERFGTLFQLAASDIGAMAVTDEAIEAAYQAQIADFEGAPEYNASHILVPTQEEAADLITRLNDGADFAELAAEASIGPSGPRGGELGWFGSGMMVPAFEEAVVALEVGQISEPVETQFGWHVVKLNDTRMTQPASLDSVREDLANTIRSEALQARIDELTAGAEITRDEEFDPNILQSLAQE